MFVESIPDKEAAYPPRCGFHGFWPPGFAGNGHPVSRVKVTLS